jgi:hypothetical protein
MKQDTNKIIHIAKYLSKMSKNLSSEAGQGWASSSYHIAGYLDEHSYEYAGLDIDRSALMAAGRLGWLLEESRRDAISGVFSETEILALINCFQGDIFSPDRFADMAADVCRYIGIDLEDYEVSIAAPLINKLLNLTALQQLMLVDTLEQVWYRSSELNGKPPLEALRLLGVELI